MIRRQGRPARSSRTDGHADIYAPEFVIALFNEMSATYGLTNLISSFGFSARWRAQCIRAAHVEPGMRVYDMMAGMNECAHLIARQLDGKGAIAAVDFCPAMCRQAEKEADRLRSSVEVRILNEDALRSSLPAASADRVVCSFGLKTLSDAQVERFAEEIARLLKPGGRCALLEISVPRGVLIRLPYLFYLRRCIPLIGKLLLGNPDNYRMLGIYTLRFRDCAAMGAALERAGITIGLHRLFFGCATMVTGTKAG